MLNDNEFEVKYAAINNIPECLQFISTEKIQNLLLPTLQNNYSDGTAQYKAGTATAICKMSRMLGEQHTIQKILPILEDLIKDDNSEVKGNVVNGILDVSAVVGIQSLDSLFK